MVSSTGISGQRQALQRVSRRLARRLAIVGGMILSVLPIVGRPPSAAAEDGIYVIKIDGSGERKVTSVEGIEYHASPRWSHDGKRLVFETRDDNGVTKSCVVNLDGTGLMELGEMGAPDWSPDDKQVVFHYDGGNMQEGAWVQNMDGGGLDFLVAGTWPRWSPDGSKIAYCDGGNLAVRDLVQGDDHLLTEESPAQRPGSFEWSRDGKRLAYFTRTIPNGPRELFIVGADRTNKGVPPRFSQQGTRIGGHVTWALGDKQLIFTIESFIHVLDAEGDAGPKLLPGQSDKSRDPACSPDGQWISFARRPD